MKLAVFLLFAACSSCSLFESKPPPTVGDVIEGLHRSCDAALTACKLEAVRSHEAAACVEAEEFCKP